MSGNTVDGLREKLRKFFARRFAQKCAPGASLNNVELITALLSCNRQLVPIGLQLRIVNRVVSLLTTQVENKALSEYLSEQTSASGNLLLTSATSKCSRIAFEVILHIFMGVHLLVVAKVIE